jgi:hypothetical protein
MLRYAPPIYTVIRRGIIFVFINILNILILLLLSIIIILLSSVISNVSYSSLRFAPLYCLIHTPLSPLVSPLSVCQPPRRGTVRHPYPKGSEKHFNGFTFGVVGVLVETLGRRRPEEVPPKTAVSTPKEHHFSG